MKDTYSVIRGSTLSWLLEKIREFDNLRDIPEVVARDIGYAINIGDVKVESTDNKLKIAGPILSTDVHEQIILESLDIELLRDKHSSSMWRQIVQIVHMMITSEAEAVLRLIGEDNE
jgi:hypothetical protein